MQEHSIETAQSWSSGSRKDRVNRSSVPRVHPEKSFARLCKLVGRCGFVVSHHLGPSGSPQTRGAIHYCLGPDVLTKIFRRLTASDEASTPSILASTTTPIRCSGASMIAVLVPCWPPPWPTSGTPAELPVPHPNA